MLIAGVCLWAQEASARPRWVRGTWSVDDGVIRRVSERYEDGARRVPFLVPAMADSHCHIGYSEKGSVSGDEMVRQARHTLESGVTLVRDCGVPVDNSVVVGPSATCGTFPSTSKTSVTSRVSSARWQPNPTAG